MGGLSGRFAGRRDARRQRRGPELHRSRQIPQEVFAEELGEWGNREWGVGSGEWEITSLFPIPDSPPRCPSKEHLCRVTTRRNNENQSRRNEGDEEKNRKNLRALRLFVVDYLRSLHVALRRPEIMKTSHVGAEFIRHVTIT